jgi:hypothetical protein
VFRIDMLPAAQGDSLWIEYGPRTRPHRVLVDGGTAPTYDHVRARIMRLPERDRHFDLWIVSHVDADHIEGVIVLLQDRSLGLSVDDVWFNGWKHLPTDRLGPAQGEMLSGILDSRKPWGTKLPWNVAFGRKAVQVPDDPQVELPSRTLAGGMKLTLMSPTRTELSILAPYWDDEVRKAHLVPGDRTAALELLGRTPKLRPDALGGPRLDVAALANEAFKKDTTKANGSSIAVLAEFDGSRALLAADAHAGVLLKTMPRLLARRPGLSLDAFKLPHHGSRKNVSLDLIGAIPAEKYLFSTSGAVYKHPDVQAVCRVLVAAEGRNQLWFNYASVHNELWRNRDLLRRFDAVAKFPEASGSGLGISVPL